MKYILFIILFLSLSSCCQKKDCSSEPYWTVVFHNFPAESLDSVWLYRLDALKMQATDSLLVRVYKDYDSLYQLSGSQLSLKDLNVYKISIPKASKEYLISDMRFKKTKDCNSCFPARPKSATYNKFVGYKINGVLKDADYIEITY